MPDSPETKPAQTSPTVAAMPRPASTSSSVMNGSIHSPHGSVNGRTPSPHDGQSQQALPPACGARQLSKLKRFLTTLQQFGSDISPEIGERVRSLVLGLVNSTISIEDFHSKLQEATNFPLRPFVIPFLKANLPLLQRELLHCARMAKQTPAQYLSQNEHVLLATRGSPQHESGDLISPELNENGKRKASPERTKENGVTVNNYNNEHMHPAKRLHPISPSLPRVSPGGVPQHLSGPLRLEDINLSREQRERENRLYPDRELRVEDDWRQVDSMLNCIIDMVERTKRTLAVLQHRAIQDREELTLWARRRAEGAEIDVKKRAEEAINEVKRQAVAELQKAVQAAEQNANDVIGKERAKMERAIEQARREAAEDALSAINHQEDTSENCWNCGRKASETCSGCNTARYCGPFCQHKDWENHHKVCGQHLEAATSTATSTATTCPATTSPADSVTSSRSSASRSATPVAENRSSNGSETSR